MTRFHSDMSWRLGVDDRNFRKGARRVENRVKKLQGTFRSVASGLGAAFGAAGLGFALLDASKKVIGFEQAMAKVKAISGATAQQFKALSVDAKRLGSSTRFTATEVAGLQLEFSKLGFSTKEILNATEATLQLATATGEDLAQAATVAGATVRGFGLDAKDTQKVVDVMAESFTSSALNLEKFQTAMAVVAPVAKNANVSLERTTAILEVLVNRGVDASSAGTALRNVFLELSKQGLTWNQAMQRIRNATDKNAEALKLFGKRGATVASIIAGATTEINQFEKANLNAKGAAEKMAATVEDTTEGALKKLSSAYEGLILKLSDSGGLNDSFRDMVEGMTESLGTFDSVIDKVGLLKTGFGEWVNELIKTKTEVNLIVKALQALNKQTPRVLGKEQHSFAIPKNFFGKGEGFEGFDVFFAKQAAKATKRGGAESQGLPGKSAKFPFPSGSKKSKPSGGGGGGGAPVDPLDRVFLPPVAPVIEYRKALESITPVLEQISTSTENLRSGTVQTFSDVSAAWLEATDVGAKLEMGVLQLGDALMQIAIQGAASAKELAAAFLNAAKQIIAATIAQAVAAAALKALKSVPFPFNLAAAGLAGAAAAALFNSIIPSFAEGGIVSGPTLAMVGDNPGGKEAIIPLNKGLKIHVIGRIVGSGRELQVVLDNEANAVFRGT